MKKRNKKTIEDRIIWGVIWIRKLKHKIFGQFRIIFEDPFILKPKSFMWPSFKERLLVAMWWRKWDHDFSKRPLRRSTIKFIKAHTKKSNDLSSKVNTYSHIDYIKVRISLWESLIENSKDVHSSDRAEIQKVARIFLSTWENELSSYIERREEIKEKMWELYTTLEKIWIVTKETNVEALEFHVRLFYEIFVPHLKGFHPMKTPLDIKNNRLTKNITLDQKYQIVHVYNTMECGWPTEPISDYKAKKIFLNDCKTFSPTDRYKFLIKQNILNAWWVPDKSSFLRSALNYRKTSAF